MLTTIIQDDNGQLSTSTNKGILKTLYVYNIMPTIVTLFRVWVRTNWNSSCNMLLGPYFSHCKIIVPHLTIILHTT